MTSVQPETHPRLFIVPTEDKSRTSVELKLGERTVSSVQILHYTLNIGAAKVRMDGIGGVGTDEAFRNRGYSRLALEACVKEMTEGDASLSMLYGIRDFYPKFGYATAGPDHLALLTDLKRNASLPEGWTSRPFETEDLPAIQAIYARNTETEIGSAVRSNEGGVWAKLLQAADGTKQDFCRVVVDGRGVVAGYVWRAKWCWYVKYKLESDYPNALVLGEAMASCPQSADALLATCRQWAQEEAMEREVGQVVLALPPESLLAAAAVRQDTRLIRNFSACGGSMARVLNTNRLFFSLIPELEARLRKSKLTFIGSLFIKTDLDEITLRITRDQIAILEGDSSSTIALQLHLPQWELARLALGAFTPEDILARLHEPPSEETSQLIQTLFPVRNPHMHLPDRY